MRIHFRTMLALALASCALILPAASTCPVLAQEANAKPEASAKTEPVAPSDSALADSSTAADFGKHVAPLFAKNCVACHNAKKAEGGLNLESHPALMKGGDSGASVVPGDTTASALLARIVDPDDPMPPVGNTVGAKPLTEAEVAVVRSWIAAGALAPAAMEAPKLQWQPLPPSVHPINALTVSNDGNYVAFGRGNQALVLRQPASSSLDQAYSLVDPQVAEVLAASQSHQSVDANALQAAHLDIVQSIAFSHDNSRVAAGGYRSVKIWRRSVAPLDTLPTGIVSNANSLSSISPDGKYLAVSTDGNAPELINLQTSESQRFLRGHAHSVTALCWLDNTKLISSDQSGVYVITSVDDQRGTKALTSQSVPSAKRLISLGPNQLLAISTEGKLYQLTVDAPGATLAGQIIDGQDGVMSIAANADGPIALGLATGVCRLLSRADFTAIRDIATAGPVQQVAVSPDGKLVATSTGTAAAQLWRAADGAVVSTLDKDYQYSQMNFVAQRNVSRQQQLIERLTAQQAELKKASEAEVAALAKVQEARDKAAAEIATKDSELVAANQAVTDGQKAIADAEAAVAAAMKMVETRKTELEAKQKAMAEAMSKKETAVADLAKRDQALATSKDAAARAAAKIPEIETTIKAENEQLATVKKHAEDIAADPAAKHQARQLAFASDSSRIAVADEIGRLHVFASSTGNPEANFAAADSTSALLVIPNGRLISLANSGVLHQWDFNLTWTLERVIGDHENSPFSDRITALDFSPDSQLLAVGSGPPSRFGEIKIIDVESGQIAHDFGEVHSDTVLALRYSPNGRKLASGGADKLCRILDAATGKQLVSLEGHTHHVLSVAWKDDGVTLATGSADLTIKIWNVETGTQSRTVSGAKKDVTALSFVGQSNQFVAANAAGIVQLIDAGNGNQVRAFAGADGAVLTVGVSQDGKHLFAGAQTGNSWAWQIEDAKKLR